MRDMLLSLFEWYQTTSSGPSRSSIVSMSSVFRESQIWDFHKSCWDTDCCCISASLLFVPFLCLLKLTNISPTPRLQRWEQQHQSTQTQKEISDNTRNFSSRASVDREETELLARSFVLLKVTSHLTQWFYLYYKRLEWTTICISDNSVTPVDSWQGRKKSFTSGLLYFLISREWVP